MKHDYIKHVLAPDGSLNPEVDPIRSAVELDLWYDAADAGNTDGHKSAGTVPTGFKYYITELSIQNKGAASIIDIYDAAAAGGLETNHKYSVDAKATDTTVVTGIMFVLETGAAIDASVCAVDHDIKIHLSGYKVKT